MAGTSDVFDQVAGEDVFDRAANGPLVTGKGMEHPAAPTPVPLGLSGSPSPGAPLGDVKPIQMNGTPPIDAAVSDIRRGRIAKPAADLIEASGRAIAPLAVPAIATATLPTLIGAGVGAGTGYLGRKGLEKIGATPDQSRLGGDIAGLAGGSLAAGLSPSNEDVGNLARMDPDEAAQRALAPPKAKAIQAQKNLAGARPYLQDAKDLQDLQARIPPAKAEIWKPYADAVEKIGDRPVEGPDGGTTVSELEKQRLETSALLQATRSMKPSDTQAALQKNQQVKALSDRYDAITGALDPELESTGINPQKIRETFGSVQGVNKLVEGRNTLTETPKRYGLGRMADITFSKPRTWLGEPLQGARDILAGRPLWSGSPTDVAVSEGFRTGGPKPDLGTVAPDRPVRGLLGAGALVTPPTTDESGITSTAAPPVEPTTRAQRLGLLLPEKAGISRPIITPPNTSESYARGVVPEQGVQRNAVTGRGTRIYSGQIGTQNSLPDLEPPPSEMRAIAARSRMPEAEIREAWRLQKILEDPNATAMAKAMAKASLNGNGRLAKRMIPVPEK